MAKIIPESLNLKKEKRKKKTKQKKTVPASTELKVI